MSTFGFAVLAFVALLCFALLLIANGLRLVAGAIKDLAKVIEKKKEGKSE